MREFLFIRHGETDWNLTKRMQGQTQNIPLNETGRQQAKDAAEYLAKNPFDLIVSSPLNRAVETAEIIAKRTGHSLIIDKRLIERSWGIAEGMTQEEYDALDPVISTQLNKDQKSTIMPVPPKGAETRDEIRTRAADTVFDLLSRHQNKRLLLVTHGAWTRALIVRLTGVDHVFPNAVPYVVSEENAGWQVKHL